MQISSSVSVSKPITSLVTRPPAGTDTDVSPLLNVMGVWVPSTMSERPAPALATDSSLIVMGAAPYWFANTKRSASPPRVTVRRIRSVEPPGITSCSESCDTLTEPLTSDEPHTETQLKGFASAAGMNAAANTVKNISTVSANAVHFFSFMIFPLFYKKIAYF